MGCAVNPPMIVCGRFNAGSDFVGGGNAGGTGRGSFDFDDGGEFGDEGSVGARLVGRGIRGRGAIAPPRRAFTPPRFDDGGGGASRAP